jgi:hypothetical protein
MCVKKTHGSKLIQGQGMDAVTPLATLKRRQLSCSILTVSFSAWHCLAQYCSSRKQSLHA